jgi:REP element-mobilizing transposase RayT
MRRTEAFSGCRVLAYCIMSNHFHLLLEVPPPPPGGVPDALLLKRLAVFLPAWKLRELQARLAEARQRGDLDEAQRLRGAHAYRMHDLSEFMKTLLQRFSSWFNRSHQRSGRLWEQRFKSVLVEDGFAARTMAAYIDLNPSRAGICGDPADYRWSSYAEALAGGKKARAGLVRVLQWREATGNQDKDGARAWAQGGLAKRYRTILLGRRTGEGTLKKRAITRAPAQAQPAATSPPEDPRDLRISMAIGRRVRYFTDGAVIGGRGFVEEVFRGCRQYFGPRRRSAARKPRGTLRELAGDIWSARDLRSESG